MTELRIYRAQQSLYTKLGDEKNAALAATRVMVTETYLSAVSAMLQGFPD